MTKNILLLLITILIVSCSSPRTLYVSNRLHHDILLSVDTTLSKNMPLQALLFVDSLNGRRIPPGHLIISFGTGKWTKQDKENLKMVMQRIRVVDERKSDNADLPLDIRIVHYGSFVNELVVKMNKP